MKLIQFTLIGGTPIYLNPHRIIAVTQNGHGQTVIVFAPETHHDFGHFPVEGSIEQVVERIKE